MEKLLSFLKDEEGISSVEYAVLLAFIVAALVTAVTALRTRVVAAFNAAVTALGG